MKLLAGGCRVFDSTDGEVCTRGNWTARLLIRHATGARRITQTVNEYASGRSPAVSNAIAEEALYVAEGEGVCRINGFAYALRPGTAVYIPPGAEYSMENICDGWLRVVSACCPEDPGRRILEQAREDVSSGNPPRLTLHERDREVIRAGKDREFRYLVHRDIGCRQITQFVGWIPPGKAPFHHHEYEEGIFILEGGGVVHVEGESCEFGAGSSVYFPQGVRHCVENNGTVPIRLLGSFYPSGSPGEAYED